MAREILFRGKIQDDKKWVEGYLFKFNGADDTLILTGKLNITRMYIGLEKYPVIPETIGQYTGLLDNQGNKIFEGDIIRVKDEFTDEIGIIEFGKYAFSGDYGYYVNWCKATDFRNELAYWVTCRGLEVIGNIHDNPELLEVER